jgi:EpsI family protein
VNAIRIFVTGFLVYYVNPALADGFSHYSEGWVLFLLALALLAGLAWLLSRIEQLDNRPEPPKMAESFAPGRASGSGGNWLPVAALALGVVLIARSNSFVKPALRTPLADALPREIELFRGRDLTVPADERQVAGVTDYLFRSYSTSTAGAEATPTFSIYVGYYDSQTQGKSIHSPKNCLPGSGWEALQSTTTTVESDAGPVAVNRYLIQKGAQQALVLYWYQGRGRVQADEYAVKWNLLRDAAVRRRSDEALVRIVVPLSHGTEGAVATALRSAGVFMRELNRALPA